MNAAPVCILAVALTGCGYHVAGHADLLPKNIKPSPCTPSGT